MQQARLLQVNFINCINYLIILYDVEFYARICTCRMIKLKFMMYNSCLVSLLMFYFINVLSIDELSCKPVFVKNDIQLYIYHPISHI